MTGMQKTLAMQIQRPGAITEMALGTAHEAIEVEEGEIAEGEAIRMEIEADTEEETMGIEDPIEAIETVVGVNLVLEEVEQDAEVALEKEAKGEVGDKIDQP